MAERVRRGKLFRWLGWFAVANALVLGVISLRYFSGYQGAQTALAWLYLVTIYASHYTWLALLPLLAVGIPLILLFPRRGPVAVAGVLLIAVMIALITLDSLLWSESRFHINLLTARILGTQSWVFVAVMFLIGLFFEAMLARGAWRWVEARPARKGGWLGAVLAVCFVVAQFLYMWADAAYYTPITGLAQQLPVHHGITAKGFMVDIGLVDMKQSREAQLAQRMASGMGESGGGSLDYPLEPLQCHAGRPMNLLVIALDAWRFDMLSEATTPRLWRWWPDHASRFTRHFSGGNSSRMGMFTLFYGLPPGYFGSFEALQRPAALVEQLQREGYQMALYTAADMYRPVALDRTAFASVPNLRITPDHPDAPAWQRDEDITALWLKFLEQRDPQRPFFGFLFYDASNAKHYPPDYPGRFEPEPGHPMAEKFAAYESAIHFDDTQVDTVLQDLARRGLADDTVVLITADHGEEFQETGVAYAKHGSGYSHYQLQVPLLLAWPGMQPRTIDYRTSHYDIAPTLLGRLLGCSNAPDTYSSGADLFDGQGWPWLIAASYYNYAVLEPDQITITFPDGLYEVRDWNYRLVDKPQFHGDVLQAVMRENRRFYR